MAVIDTRVCQMPFFKKIKSPTGFSYGIYPKDYENAKKIQKLNSRGLARALEVLLHSASI